MDDFQPQDGRISENYRKLGIGPMPVAGLLAGYAAYRRFRFRVSTQVSALALDSGASAGTPPLHISSVHAGSGGQPGLGQGFQVGVEGWKRSRGAMQPPVISIAMVEQAMAFMWCMGKGVIRQSRPGCSSHRPPPRRYHSPQQRWTDIRSVRMRTASARRRCHERTRKMGSGWWAIGSSRRSGARGSCAPSCATTT